MLLFVRGITLPAVDFGERALKEEMLVCLREAEYYEQLARKYQSKSCLEHGQKMLDRFYYLAGTKLGKQIIRNTLFEKRGDFYEAVQCNYSGA